jgi:hypothetical protein
MRQLKLTDGGEQFVASITDPLKTPQIHRGRVAMPSWLARSRSACRRPSV